MGTETPKLDEKTPEATKASPKTALANEVSQTVATEAELAGVDLSPEKMEDPANFMEALNTLSSKIGMAMDKIAALFAHIGVPPSEIEAALHVPGAAVTSPEEPEPESKISTTEHLGMIKESCAKYGGKIKPSTVCAIIKMESNWDPEARPKGKNGKYLSDAYGLAQATTKTFNEYKRETGNINAQQNNPKDAIDFTAWYCNILIKRVANLNPAPKYLIDPNDVEHLYMAYNNGPAGYITLRTYLDDPTPANFNSLQKFQRNNNDWKPRSEYAKKVAVVARNYEENMSAVEQKYEGNFASAPLENFSRVSSSYDVREHPITHDFKMHNGIDLAAAAGTKVLAVNDATVLRVDSDESNGNYVFLKLSDGTIAQYLHLRNSGAREDGSRLRAGETVTSGSKIGEVGSTGHSTGPHLHFALKTPDGKYLNPTKATMAKLNKSSNS